MTACLSAEDFRLLIQPLAERLPGADCDHSIRDVAVEILNCAQNFVPSEAGSIMMSHPTMEGALVFVASFGEGSEQLPGTVLPAQAGIAGQVYSTGKAVITNAPNVQRSFYDKIDKLTNHQTESLLCVPLSAFGQSVGVLSLLNRIGDGFKESDLELLGIFSDHLTQSIQLILEARRQREAALRDHLTGLFNDRYLYFCLHETIEKARNYQTDVGLIFLDLDHFKAVVDTHGHLVGSQALGWVGRLVGKVVEAYRGIPARYGGDEYVVVLPETTPNKVLELSEKLREAIELATIECPGEAHKGKILLERQVTASVGAITLSALNDPDQKPVDEVRQELIRRADVAMYKAKDKGKNCVHWGGEDLPD